MPSKNQERIIRQKRAMTSATANVKNALESISGAGSSISMAKSAAILVHVVIATRKPSVVLDIPCGDCNWIRHVRNISNTHYIGADINSGIVEGLSNESWGEFVCLDAVCDKLPNADLVICRDMIQHLTLDDGVAALRNIMSTGCRILILTTHNCTENEDIDGSSWGWRPLNMFVSPFINVFGHDWRVIHITQDGDGAYGKMLVVLERKTR